MRVKNIKIGVKSLKENLNEFADIWKKLENSEDIKKQEAVYFENIDAVRSVLTHKRIEILKAIKRDKPDSIYQLAKMLKRDLKNVNDDVRLLADLGLIKLDKTKTDRKRTIPEVNYSKIMLEIGI